MSSFFSIVRIKNYLGEERNLCIGIFIIFCYVFGGPLSIVGLKELYKTRTFVIHQCQVKSIDLKTRQGYFYPLWNITVLYENQTRDDSLIASTGSSTNGQAWRSAYAYKVINEILL
jgi:hypothetical protein